MQGADDALTGLELARLAGGIGAVGLALDRLTLPGLAAILAACGARLRALSAAALLRADLARDLADELVATGGGARRAGRGRGGGGGRASDRGGGDGGARRRERPHAGVALAARASDEADRAAKLAPAARAARRAAREAVQGEGRRRPSRTPATQLSRRVDEVREALRRLDELLVDFHAALEAKAVVVAGASPALHEAVARARQHLDDLGQALGAPPDA